MVVCGWQTLGVFVMCLLVVLAGLVSCSSVLPEVLMAVLDILTHV